MSVREDIMAMTCNPMESYDDSEFARYRIGFHHAKNKAVEIAEASEKAQQAKLNALIAELRELRTTPISNNDESIEFIWFAIAEHDLEEIINKYEDKP